MRKHTNSSRAILQLCALLLFTMIPCCGGAQQAPPQGLVVSSVLVNPAQYTPNGGQYDLFLQTIPGEKITRLTDHRAAPKLKLGGAISEPLFSHDGKRVIFLANYEILSSKDLVWTGVTPYNNHLLNIWEVSLDTRKVSPITKGDLGWTIYGWSPDDRYVCAVYQTKLPGLPGDEQGSIPDDIYVWDMHTHKGCKLVRVPDGVGDAFWSYDGKNVLYQSGASANLYSVPRQGGKSKILLRGKAGRHGYTFSPDGHKVAYADAVTVYVANANGSEAKPVSKMEGDEHSPNWAEMRWSQDGTKLAIVVYGQPVNGRFASNLRIYDLVTGNERVVAKFQQSVGRPVWSRNGKWLIVTMAQTGQTEKPDPKTGWHAFHHDGLMAVSVADGQVVVLKEPSEETNGLAWFEVAK